MGFESPWILLLFIVAVPFILALRRSEVFTKKVLDEFKSEPPSRGYFIAKYILAVTFAASLVVVAANPYIEPRVTGDYLFLSDTSRSMEARSSCGDRTFLERAKVVMRDVMDGVPEGRFAIVAFDRLAFPVTQMTYDHAYLREVLNNGLFIGMSYRATGTNLGNALSVVAQKKQQLPDLYGNVRYVILLSDGNLESEAWKTQLKEPLDELKQENIKVVAVGIGNPIETPIPITTPDGDCRADLIEVDGQTVRIPLREDILGQIASETQGAYFGEAQTDELIEFMRKNAMTEVPDGADFHEEQRNSVGWIFLIFATASLLAFLLL